MRDNGELAVNGGLPVRTRPWPTFSKGTNYIQESDQLAAMRVILGRKYHRYDARPVEETECGRFEDALRDYFGCRHAIGVANGSVAIALALLALDLPKGSLIACSGFTFTATPSAILMAGHRPLLLEVDENLHLDLDHLRANWNPDIRAIVMVHMRGVAGDVEAVVDFADSMGVPVVEDAVPALGAEVNGRKLGTFGRVGAFSMQSGKMLNTGEGGFIVTNDDAVYQRALVLAGGYETHLNRHVSEPLVDWRALPVYNFRLDEIRAALATSELEHLDRRVAHHHTNHEWVAERLTDLDKIHVRRPAKPGGVLGDSLIIRLPGEPELARWFAKALTAEGIDARAMGEPAQPNARCFWNWAYLFPGDDEAARKRRLPVTYRYLSEAVDVPMSHALGKHDCEQLVDAVGKLHKTL